MKKRILSAVLALCMLLTLLPAAVLAAENAGSCGDNVKWSLSGGELTISGSGPMYDYNYFDSRRAPWYGQEITSVVIRNGVTSIGEGVFYGCTSLTGITIPNSVTTIGAQAFSGCAGLSSITLPDSVTDIGFRAFSGCTSLTSITIPDSVTDIGWYAFADCTNLTSITIPDSVSSIGDEVFSGCANLTGIALPDSVTYIGAGAFHGCASLTSITIPNSVGGIGRGVFDGCTSLIQIDVAPGNANYRSVNGVLMNQDATELICYPGGKRGSYTIPTGVTSIGWYAFYDCGNLTGITIPDGVTSIGRRAFYNCASLTSITIPDSVSSIADEAFSGCASLTNIALPDSLTSIENEAFCGCASLTSITIPNSVTNIERCAFDGCTSLIQIDVAPGNANFRSLDGVLMNQDATELIRCPGGKRGSYTIPTGVTSIGWRAFYDCTSLTSITIPNSVTSIDTESICGCTSLIQIDLAPGNASYRLLDGVLMNRKATKLICCPGGKRGSYTIPTGVTSIAQSAFYGCAGLTSIIIPDSVTSIGIRAFDGCTSLHSITIPDSVTKIDICTFQNCTSLTSITIPASVTKIGYSAFENCVNLTSVTIPASVTEIGNTAFYLCTNLTSVIIPDSASIGYCAFDGCNDLTIYGCRNTMAETYAREHDIPFVCLGFADLVSDKFYYNPVLWATKKDITSGVTDTEFAPYQDCTRAQVVTFLWRAMGCPEPNGNANPFVDVESGRFYYKAILWAAENNITSGVDATHFAPNKTVTRGEFVTFLWRAIGSPNSNGDNPFGDVSKDRFYCDAVLWAAQAGITTGVAPGAFRPSDSCTRGQVVTFLYRIFGE